MHVGSTTVGNKIGRWQPILLPTVSVEHPSALRFHESGQLKQTLVCFLSTFGTQRAAGRGEFRARSATAGKARKSVTEALSRSQSRKSGKGRPIHVAPLFRSRLELPSRGRAPGPHRPICVPQAWERWQVDPDHERAPPNPATKCGVHICGRLSGKMAIDEIRLKNGRHSSRNLSTLKRSLSACVMLTHLLERLTKSSSH